MESNLGLFRPSYTTRSKKSQMTSPSTYLANNSPLDDLVSNESRSRFFKSIYEINLQIWDLQINPVSEPSLGGNHPYSIFTDNNLFEFEINESVTLFAEV